MWCGRVGWPLVGVRPPFTVMEWPLAGVRPPFTVMGWPLVGVRLPITALFTIQDDSCLALIALRAI